MNKNSLDEINDGNENEGQPNKITSMVLHKKLLKANYQKIDLNTNQGRYLSMLAEGCFTLILFQLRSLLGLAGNA